MSYKTLDIKTPKSYHFLSIERRDLFLRTKQVVHDDASFKFKQSENHMFG